MTSEIVGEVSADVTEILSNGDQCRFRHFTGSVSATGWDDEQTLTKSGNDIYTSGVNLPFNRLEGSADAILLEQGKIKQTDLKLYVEGTIETTSTMKIGLGSPVGEEYSVVPDGIINLPPYGTPAYKKLYLRYLPLGSLSGE